MSTVRRHVLERLGDGKAHPGASIAAELGVSRAAVAKQVARLRAAGWNIVTAGEGYRLSPGRLPLVRAELERALAEVAGTVERLELLEVVDSTSSHLARLPAAGTGRVQVCVAEHQQAGRGRRGRHWHARPGGSIAFSVAASLPLAPSALAGLSIAAGAVCAEVLAKAGLEDVRLKWPNDLMHHGAKLGGILVEIGGEVAGASRVIVGVGVNHDLGEACLEDGRTVTDIARGAPQRLGERGRITGALVYSMVKLLEDFPDSGLAPWLPRWSVLDELAGRTVEVEAPEGPVQGTAIGVAPDGALRLQTAAGERVFHSGEVSVRRTS